MDNFKTEFKFFRKKLPKPNLSEVLNFDNELSSSLIRRFSLEKNSILENCNVCKNLGLQCHSFWDVYGLTDKNGFIFIKNPFTVSGQRKWIRNSMEIYPKKPSVTNLDSRYDVDDIWNSQWSADLEKRNYLSKLRWATFGYHHNWDTKKYSCDNVCAFPPCLKSLSMHIASCLGYQNYSPEAAIVNYYHMDSSLGGHVDFSELDYTAPIISLSFGQTAVFLLGGETKTAKPCAMFLRSGDIVVMGGQCRLAYHAMPLIIREETSDRFKDDDFEGNDWKPFAEYLETSRVNINIRQVFPQ